MEPITPTTPAAPAQSEPTIDQHNTVSQSEHATLIEWAKQNLQAGTITQAQFDQQANELNVPMDQRTLDNRTEAAKELDAAGFVPAKEEAFLFPVSAEAIPQEGKQAVRTWAAAAGADLVSGNTLIKTCCEVDQQLGSMSEAQRLDYAPKQLALLQKQYGDSLDERFAQARTMIDVLEAQRPGLKALLNSGVGDSARIVAQIFALSDRYHARRRG
jgi:hypothetical protein